jgi:hypothetical protein
LIKICASYFIIKNSGYDLGYVDFPEYINELIEADRNGGKMLCAGN